MRLLGAIFRAFWVIVVVAIPSLVLPSASQGAAEFSLIIGGIIAIFTVFEYGSDSPGFVDFRFAPPYNRFRAFTIAIQVILVTLVARAIELNLADAAILDWAQTIAVFMDFPFSPVSNSWDLLIEGSGLSDTSAILLVYTTSISFVAGFAFMIIFSTMLWVFKWPLDRASFNLWINLPMFQPSDGVSVPKRLRRDALVNIILGLTLIYALPYLPIAGLDWLTTDLFENNQALIWAAVLWVFIPTTLLARAAAMWKIARIISRARRGKT